MDADLVVIGAGLAGVSAALAAASKGKRVLVVSAPGGATVLTSGAWDVLPAGALPPGHPYHRLPGGVEGVGPRTAEVLARLRPLGLDLEGEPRSTRLAPHGLGMVVSTNLVPRNATLQAGRPEPFLVVGTGSDPDQTAFLARALEAWGCVAGLDVPVPHTALQEHPFTTAARLDDPVLAGLWAKRVADAARGLGARRYFFPAILGLELTGVARGVAEKVLGAPVAELLSSVPSAPGLRLGKVLDRALAAAGVDRLEGRAFEAEPVGRDLASLQVASQGGRTWQISARAWVLATGRFLGGGLESPRPGVLVEPLLGLPLVGPSGPLRSVRPPAAGLREDEFAQVGLAADDRLRPLNELGEPAYENVYAAGAILGAEDPALDGTGLGLAAETGWAAGTAAAEHA